MKFELKIQNGGGIVNIFMKDLIEFKIHYNYHGATPSSSDDQDVQPDSDSL